MFTVKLLKYVEDESNDKPIATEAISLTQAKSVHVRYEPYHGPTDTPARTVLQLGDAPGDTTEVTIGKGPCCSYSRAYVMNDQGRTVETIY